MEERLRDCDYRQFGCVTTHPDWYAHHEEGCGMLNIVVAREGYRCGCKFDKLNLKLITYGPWNVESFCRASLRDLAILFQRVEND